MTVSEPLRRLATYEMLLNPRNSDRVKAYLEFTAQSHWHVFVCQCDSTILNVIGIENDYDLTEFLSGVVSCV